MQPLNLQQKPLERRNKMIFDDWIRTKIEIERWLIELRREEEGEDDDD